MLKYIIFFIISIVLSVLLLCITVTCGDNAKISMPMLPEDSSLVYFDQFQLGETLFSQGNRYWKQEEDSYTRCHTEVSLFKSIFVIQDCRRKFHVIIKF